MDAFKDTIDRILNWSGGSYTGLATLTIVGLAIAQFVGGEPVSIVDATGKPVIYLVHRAPEWFVGPIGVYTVILALFWAGKPVNAYINQKANPPAPVVPERQADK